MASIIRCDVAVLGAGLAGGLIALALKGRRPDLDVRLIDAESRAGGNHVWSFFGSDVDGRDRWIVEPLVAHGWRGYTVCFPAHRRTIDATYYSLTSERLDAELHRALPDGSLLLGRRVLAASPRAVVLADGDRIEAGGVIDARGPGDLSHLDLGWQKFVGRELVLRSPNAVKHPVVMDGTVEQVDGYRFVYLLPFAADRLFVEDTYYSDTPDLDRAAVADRIDSYAAGRGWQVARYGRTEAGVLPVAIGGDFEAYWRSSGAKLAKAGVRAGLFHPTTGYSLPDAVRTAAMLADQADLSGTALHDATYALARRTWEERGFYRMLDTMLFRAAEPAERYRVLERFYRLHPDLIGRFYAGRSTMADKARILTGKPPVPITRALRALAGLKR